MSQPLSALDFPLYGSRLIEASAGTGKTWTIAALYLRLVLGHGAEPGLGRALTPGEILVMTFTRAATRELSERIRTRLIEAAAYFRDPQPAAHDEFLSALMHSHASGSARNQAAHRLLLAAESMDNAAVFTIDAWCQRMLREHAFDSGNLFDEELVADEAALLDDAVRDYWRQQIYPLEDAGLDDVLAHWSDVNALQQAVRPLLKHADLFAAPGAQSLRLWLRQFQRERHEALNLLKGGWLQRTQRMQDWLQARLAENPKCFNGSKLKPERAQGWFQALCDWAGDPALEAPQLNATAWKRLSVEGISDACSKGVQLQIPREFDEVAELQLALAALPALKPQLLSHAVQSIVRRMEQLKRQGHQFGFADMLQRLKTALEGENGAALRQRIVTQYPVALVDEFQDTDPVQYRIFDLLYRTADNSRASGLFLIGDPKQSIYAFRGADIHSYLAARRATAGRHYLLDTNYRSTVAQVAAVNRLFMRAEGGEGAAHPRGAFLYRCGEDNPLPFEAVRAHGRKEKLQAAGREVAALTFWLDSAEDLNAAAYRQRFAALCAEQIVTLLNDPAAGFLQEHGEDEGERRFTRLRPADVAVLVRDRNEAAAIARALQRRQVASVYLSDKDSVLNSPEALDVLRWLHAVATPLDGALARAAFATATAALPLATLIELACDDRAWEQRVEQLKQLQRIWQRQGVLAMLRQFLHQLDLPARLLAAAGGERRLTNLLHLAELLQTASQQLEGEQALIRWLAEQIAADAAAGDERILRLESDADLVKVVTVHKSKGLEYPLVFLPFAVSARPLARRNRDYLELSEGGVRRLDFTLSDEALQSADTARLAEDLRLLYVAVTRARHALWLGVAAISGAKQGSNKLHESALGYLLGAGEPMTLAGARQALEALRQGCDAIEVQQIEAAALTCLARGAEPPPLLAAAHYDASFDRHWNIGSFTSLTRDLETWQAPTQSLQQKTLEMTTEPGGAAPATDLAPWHAFPRGPLAGNFLHELLEWLGLSGFEHVNAAGFGEQLAKRCEYAGWEHRQEQVQQWLRAIATTRLPPLECSLAQLSVRVPEMEFWLPSPHLDALRLDQLCRRYLFAGQARPALPARTLHGMLKGYADLVFEHQGRYWIIDYKSNALGADDAAYQPQTLADAMLSHRYDVQGAIYMLALHRLLRSRLGAAYDPARQLGGALFLFLRGIHGPEHGCCVLPAATEMLEQFDALLERGAATDDRGVMA